MILKLILLIMISSCLYGGKYSVKTYIPENAYKYMGTVYSTAYNIIDDDVMPYIFSSLIEQESCVRLHGTGYYARRCWSPISELKTKREQGIGFGQITRAWRRDGSLRFDTLYNLKQKYPKELQNLTWDNIKERPDLQIKAILLLWRDNYNMLNKKIDVKNRIAFTDSMYNGGYKYLYKERQECMLRKGCDSFIWFNNVEKIKSARAKRKLYGNKTAWDINRKHVYNVLKVRLLKYKKHYKKMKFCREINGTKVYGW